VTSLTENLDLLTPEFALAGLAFLVFAVDLFLQEGKKGYLAWISIAGLIALILVSLVMLWDEDETLYDGLLAVDAFALFFKVFFMGMGFIHSVTEQSLKDFLNLGNLYIRIRSSILSINPFLN